MSLGTKKSAHTILLNIFSSTFLVTTQLCVTAARWLAVTSHSVGTVTSQWTGITRSRSRISPGSRLKRIRWSGNQMTTSTSNISVSFVCCCIYICISLNVVHLVRNRVSQTLFSNRPFKKFKMAIATWDLFFHLQLISSISFKIADIYA